MSKYYCSGCDRIVGTGFFAGHGTPCRGRPEDMTPVLSGETFEQVRQRSHVNRRHSAAMFIASIVCGLYGYSRTHEAIGAVVGAVIGIWIGSTRVGSQLILWITVIAIGVFLWQFTRQ